MGHRIFIQIGPIPDLSGSLCAERGLDPEMWYQDEPDTQTVALKYCWLCPRGPLEGDDSCFKQGLHEEKNTGYLAFGIRGGRTAAQRQPILDLAKAELKEEKRNAERLLSE